MILAVGRLCDTKGYPDLIRACAILAARGVGFRCRIVGDGYMREEIEAMIGNAGLGDRIEITGLLPRDGVVDQYRRARLFALPCVVTPRGDRDGLPNVVVEAMAMGLPVVSTNVSGLPEAVADGETGCLVPPHSPEGLADAIEKLWNAPDQRRKMGEEARRRVRETFGLQSNMDILARETHRRDARDA